MDSFSNLARYVPAGWKVQATIAALVTLNLAVPVVPLLTWRVAHR
jgi:hypothetical protein